MSYILEALRKAERERQLGEAPSVPEILSVEPASRRNSLPWLAALLLLVLNGGLLWHFGLNGKTQAVSPPASEARASPAQTLAPEPAKQAQPQNPVPPPAKANAVGSSNPPFAKGGLGGISAEMNKRQAIASRETMQAGAKQPKPPITDDSFGKPLARKAQAEEALPAEDKPVLPSPPPVLAKRRPAPVQEEQEAEPFVPSLKDMPQEVKEAVPDVKINVLAYSSVPEERFAVINMVKYTKGERLPGGAVVQDIQAHGVVLEVDGKRFRISNR